MIELTEIWKAMNISNYPIQVTKMSPSQTQSCTRACSNGKLVEKGKSTSSQATFLNDASKIWNSAPDVIKNCQTMDSKKGNKKIVITLPI